LLVILAVLVGVAAYLWWMNAQGKSIFSPKTADVQPVAVEEPAPVADASASSNIGGGFDENDICYVDPNLDGKQEKVQDFVQWVNESFTDVADGDGNYAWLFDYFIDRAAMTADLCHTGGDQNALQPGVLLEQRCVKLSYAGRDRDLPEFSAICEGMRTDPCHMRGDRNVFQPEAATECIFADLGDTVREDHVS